MKKIFKKLHTPNWLFILLFFVLVLRVPSFYEPYSYGDEMIYLTLGEGIRKGVPLYSQLHDNKPPLLYLVAGVSGNLFWFKAILTVWSLLTIFIFWKFVERLFPKKNMLQIVSTVCFSILTTIPLLEGNIANAELFMIGPTILSFYLLIDKKLTRNKILFAGALLSISSLFKIPAAFDIPAILIFWLVSAKKIDKQKLIKILKNFGYLLIGFTLPILVTFVWYFIRGAFTQYLIAAYLQNFGYLSSWRPSDAEKSFIEKNLPLLIRGFISMMAIFILFIKRKLFSRQFIFTSSWLILTLFAVTLSERPYPHYLIQSVAPISILVGILFAQKSIEQVLAIIPLSLAIFVPYYYNFWHYKTFEYYERFVKFQANKISKEEYLSSFGSHVPRNYEVSRFLIPLTRNSDKIFVWGDTSTIYALTDRLPPIKYIADYHINDFWSKEEVIKALANDMPSYIVVLPNSGEFYLLEEFVKSNYGLVENIEGAQIYKLLNPKVRALIAQ